jgi:hypothetical protein
VLVTNTGTGTVRVLPDIGAAALSGYYGEPAIANGPYGLGTGASFDVSIAGQNGYAGDGSWSGDAESLTFTATGNVASIAISGDLTVHAGRNSGDLSGHNVGASAGGEIANIAAAANVVSLTAGGSIGAIQAGSAQTSATPPVPEFQDEWTRPTRPSFSSAGDILGPVNAAGSIGRVTVEGSILGSISAGRAIDGVWAAFDILGAITAGEGSLEVDAWGAIAGAITAEDAVNVWAFDALSGDVHAVNGKSDAGTWAERNGSVVGMTSASAFAFGNAAALLAAADAPAQPRKEVRADGPADLVTGEDVTYYQVVNNKDNVRIDAGKSVDIVESFAGKNMWVAAHEGSVKGRYSAEGWDYVRAYTDVDAHIEAKAIASVTAWNDLKGVVISADGVDAIVGRNLTGVIEAKSWVALEVGGDSNGPIKAGDGDTFGEVTASVGGNVLKPIESTGLVDLSAAGNVRSDVTAQKGSCSVILNPCRSCDYLILAMTTPRTMTKSPRAVAQQALRLAQEALPAYSSKFSRKDCTQHQLFAPLSLKTFFKTDYRGVIALLHDFAELREDLGVDKVPHYSTLCYAEQRLLKKEEAVFLLSQATVRAQDRGLIGERPEAAIDATDLESQHTSSYFFKRAGKKHSARLWTKLTVVCDTGSHCFTAATVTTGPSNDAPQFAPALYQATLIVSWDRVLGDAAFDSEEHHRLCREEQFSGWPIGQLPRARVSAPSPDS